MRSLLSWDQLETKKLQYLTFHCNLMWQIRYQIFVSQIQDKWQKLLELAHVVHQCIPENHAYILRCYYTGQISETNFRDIN